MNITNYLRKAALSELLILWIGVFAFTTFTSFALQLWLIPAFFAQEGAEIGLVVRDSILFDAVAKQKAIEIMTYGWSAWELRPRGFSPAGIASAFYAVFDARPSSLILFNAIIHAATACVVFSILRSFFPSYPAKLGALLFVVNPTTFEWAGQIHKDGLFILGNLILINHIFNLNKVLASQGTPQVRELSRLVLLTSIGVVLIWVARPYWLPLALFCLMISAMIILFCYRYINDSSRKTIFGPLVIFSLPLLLVHIYLMSLPSPSEFRPISDSDNVTVAPIEATIEATPVKTISDKSNRWQPASWLPASLDNVFFRIAYVRYLAIQQGGNTLIDEDRYFRSAYEVLHYVPRALVVAILSPFPDVLSGQGSTPAMTSAKKIVGAIIPLFYFCLIGTIVGASKFLRISEYRAILLVLILFIVIGLILFALAQPNTGTLMRHRYVYHMLLISFGLAYWTNVWITKKE